MTLTENDDELIFEEDSAIEETQAILPWKMMRFVYGKFAVFMNICL